MRLKGALIAGAVLTILFLATPAKAQVQVGVRIGSPRVHARVVVGQPVIVGEPVVVVRDRCDDDYYYEPGYYETVRYYEPHRYYEPVRRYYAPRSYYRPVYVSPRWDRGHEREWARDARERYKEMRKEGREHGRGRKYR